MTDQTAVGSLAAEPRLAASGAEVGDFVALLKPRVMSLVVFSGLAGLMIAPGAIHPHEGALRLGDSAPDIDQCPIFRDIVVGGARPAPGDAPDFLHQRHGAAGNRQAVWIERDGEKSILECIHEVTRR